MKTRFEGAALVLLLSSVAAVAIAQPDAGTLLNQEQRSQQRLPDRLPQPEAEALRPALKEVRGARVVVKTVRFTGAANLAAETELQALVADAIGREFDFAGLEQLAYRVTEYLRGKGWFLAEAYLPRQDVTDGEIEIAIRAGRLDGKAGQGEPFVIVPSGKTALRIAHERLQAIAAAKLAAGAAVRDSDLERALLVMGDLPGINSRARLEPGSEAGSTRIMINVEEGPLLTGSASLDNYGNRDTGLEQLNFAAQINDPAGIGDQIALSAVAAQGIKMARLGYTLPLGAHGWKLGVALSEMRYEIIRGTGAAAGLEGSSETLGLTLSYPIVRSRADNVYFSLGLNRKALVDDSSAGVLDDKRVDSGGANLFGDSLDTRGGGGLTSWNVGVAKGRLDLSRVQLHEAADAAGYDTQGDYAKLNYGIGRLQKLPGRFAFFANFSGQTSGKNLDSSEKFILGGPNGVRAYSGSEGSGDSGWLANLELRYDAAGGSEWGQLQFVGFVDAGHIRLHHDPKQIPVASATGRNAYGLAGWGMGMNLAKTGSHALRLAWARKFGDNPGRSTAGLNADSRADKSRLWLQATLWF